MFKQALKMGLRFKSTLHNNLTVEDLFNYPLTKLKAMANHYNAQVKAPTDLFATRTTQETQDKLRLDILLEVINDRGVDAEAKKTAEENRAFNKQLDQLIIQKQNDALAGKSVEELIAMKK